jgi:hypothetical protein
MTGERKKVISNAMDCNNCPTELPPMAITVGRSILNPIISRSETSLRRKALNE